MKSDHLLQLCSRIFLVGLIASLTACGTTPPPPPLKPNEFERLAVLPVLEWKASGGIASLSTTASNRRAITTVPAVVYDPTTLGMAIGAAVRAAKDSDYNALSDAASAVQLNAIETLVHALNERAAATGIHLDSTQDADLAARLRNDDYTQLPTSLDGVIDIQVYNVGYYDLGRGRGYAPYLRIDAIAFDLVNPGEAPGEWRCEADGGSPDSADAEMLFPDSLVMKTLPELRENSALIKAEFTRMLELCGARFADGIGLMKRESIRPL